MYMNCLLPNLYLHMIIFLNNQPDALVMQILFCYEILHVSGKEVSQNV